MPELPEVEITRRMLAPDLIGRRIQQVTTSKRSYFFLTSPAVLKERLTQRTVTALDRHGKYLLARLDDESTLLLHLGMTGQLFTATQKSDAKPKGTASPSADHTHLRLQFTDPGPDICFRDVRKFGKVKWLKARARDKRLERLGVDALSATQHDLHQAARSRRVPIKTLLLDQAVLAGIGNIYADEALFIAQVRPTRAAYRVSLLECQRLVEATQSVMKAAIAAGGSTIRDFMAPNGHSGSYQDQRLVYSRTGSPCVRCKTTIRRIVLATRSTHYCPCCQR